MSELYRVASVLCHMEATIQDENCTMDSTDKLSIIYTCIKICQQALGNYLDAHEDDSKILEQIRGKNNGYSITSYHDRNINLFDIYCRK